MAMIFSCRRESDIQAGSTLVSAEGDVENGLLVSTRYGEASGLDGEVQLVRVAPGLENCAKLLSDTSPSVVITIWMEKTCKWPNGSQQESARGLSG